MESSIKCGNDLTKSILKMDGTGVTFEVLEYEELEGGQDVASSIALFFIKEAKIKLRQIRITLQNSSVKLEAGALHFLKGNIEMDSKMGGVLGIGKKLFSSKVTGETVFKPTYRGRGEIYLEPSFGHYTFIKLYNEEVIVDDGLFYACEDTIEIGSFMQKNLSSAMLGNEGLFQTKIKGKGLVALELPVPESEIIKYTLNDETLKVDGNFAILRTGNVEFTVEKSSKSIIGSATSGEGLLNVFRGTGEVWLAPTNSIYNNLKVRGLSGMTNPGGTSNTKV